MNDKLITSIKVNVKVIFVCLRFLDQHRPTTIPRHTIRSCEHSSLHVILIFPTFCPRHVLFHVFCLDDPDESTLRTTW